MKINEILNEAGFLSKLGQGIKAGVAGYKQSRDLRKSTEQLDQATNDALKNYTQFLASYNASGKQITPAVVAQWMTNYTRTKPKGKPAGVGLEQIRPWVAQQLGNYFASKQLGQQSDSTAGSTQPSTKQAGSLLSQIKFMDDSPLVYQFGGKNNLFTLNDKDQWVKYIPGSTKVQPPVDANTAQLLTKAAQRDKIDLAALHPAASKKTPAQTAQNKTPDIVTQTDATKTASVTTPRGIKADKWSDGKWTTPDDEGKDAFVVDSDVPQLEKLLQQQNNKQPSVFTSNRRT